MYARDADRLYEEYFNLRMNLYNRYQGHFRNIETKNQLMSYIDEQFVKLVKEYDINSPVDFPGYIKTKLTSRVAYGFVRGKHRDNNREVIMKEEGTLKQMLEQDGELEYPELDMLDLTEFLFEKENLPEMYKDVLQGWLDYKTEREITVEVAEKYETTYASVDRLKDEMKKIVREKLGKY